MHLQLAYPHACSTVKTRDVRVSDSEKLDAIYLPEAVKQNLSSSYTSLKHYDLLEFKS